MSLIFDSNRLVCDERIELAKTENNERNQNYTIRYKLG